MPGGNPTGAARSRLVTRAIALVALCLCVLAGFAWWRGVYARLPTGPVRIGYVHDPPYMFQGEDGRPRGLSVEVVAEAARRADVRLEWVRVDPSADADAALVSSRVELWPSLTVLERRRPAIYFTEPWLRSDVYLVVNGTGPVDPETFAGTLAAPPLPVLRDLAKVLPQARLIELPDGPALVRALCTGEVDSALLNAGDYLKATTSPHLGCGGRSLYANAFPGSTLRIAVASTPASRHVAEAIREQIDAMAADGTLKNIVLPYSLYASWEVLAVYDALQSRIRARFLAYGIIGLSLSLLAATAFCVALYRAHRSARRALADREAMEEKLRLGHRLEAVGQLAGGVAHDFNNLITVILGNCEMAEMDAGDRPELKAALEQIKNAGRKGADLVRQLLAFSRKQVVTPRALSLHDELRRLQPMLKRLLREDVTVTMDLRALDDRVLMDPGQLSQVAFNLAVNARDAMPEGGLLSISTASTPASGAHGRTVTLAVEDTGVGMPPDVQARVFEPFFSTKAPGKGTGLGLATVYRIVSEAGGSVDLRSDIGKGTCFTITFPVTEQSMEAPVESLLTSPTHVSATALVVEDKDEVRRLVVAMLARAGYTVLEAADGAAGLALLRARDSGIAVVVSDLVMPGLSGRAMIETARQEGIDTPVVYMSGYSEDLHPAADFGAEVLQKPFGPTELTRAVSRALGEAGLAVRAASAARPS